MPATESALKGRGDIHSPANFNPEHYEYVGAFDNSPEFPRQDNPVVQELQRLVTTSPSARYGDCNQCDHCGARIRYVGVFKHVPTGDHIAVGQVCTDNRFPLSKVDFDRLRKQAQLDRERQRLLTAWNEFKAEHPFFAPTPENAPLSWNDFYESENEFVKDVLRRGRQYGSISERQSEAIYRAVVRDHERAAHEAEELANPTPRIPVPTGKGLVITGRVVSAKLKDTQYGSVWKILVVVTDDATGAEYKVWGSLPASLRDLIDYGPRLANGGFGPPKVATGTVVTFTANVERSADDEAFGFFSRPRKASVVERAAAGAAA